MNVLGSVLYVAAHPDDAELSCAGTLMMEKLQGKMVGIADLTAGELGTRGTHLTRQQESEEATRILGIDVRVNVGIPDGFFENSKPHQLEVIKVIRRFRPSIILTNAPSDRHPDHGRAAALVRDAAFLSGLRKVDTFWQDEQQEAWRPTQVFHFIQDRFLQPSFVYDITPVIDRKIMSIKAFKSQFDTVPDDEPQTYISTPAFLESIIERSKMMGKMIGVPHAEGFITEKVPGITSFDAFVQNVT
ncbi:MAG: bacillithiol biosynthesis deacetylase BshB1 [Chitinophagaceae bacterium]|nr:bacillithiol biosynthesis deacetylase BshB1 [Chitinophagaceae bacterium]